MTSKPTSEPGGGPMIRYEPDEQPPPVLAAGTGLQLAALNIAAIMLIPLVVMRAAGATDAYLAWTVLASVTICGLTTGLQAFRAGRIGAGHVMVMGTSGAFIPASIMALREGGPGAAGHSGRRIGAGSARALVAAGALPADPDARRFGNRDNAHPGHRDAFRLGTAFGRRRRERPAGNRAQLPRDGARHRRSGAQGHRGAPRLGPRHRRARRIGDGGGLRPVRPRTSRCGSVGRPAPPPPARFRPRFRPGFLDASALVPARGRGRRRPHDEQHVRHPARVVAQQEPPRRLPRRAGSHGRRRRGQPPGRAGRNGAGERHDHQRVADPAHRSGGAGRRRGDRRGVRRIRLPPRRPSRPSWPSRTRSSPATWPSCWPCSSRSG